MPVFYVHLTGGEATAEADGLAFADLDAAIADCVQAAREHISEAAATGGRLGLDRRFEIFGPVFGNWTAYDCDTPRSDSS